MNKYKVRRDETKQEHASRYLKILMEKKRIPNEEILNVGLAVERFLNGEVTSEYSYESIVGRWAS